MKTHLWPTQGVTLHWFSQEEFRRPELLGAEFLLLIDEAREISGVPWRIVSDYRSQEEEDRLYISTPLLAPDTPHKRGAIDVQPIPNTASNRMRIVGAVTGLWLDGNFPRLGLGIETLHIHIDQDTVLHRPHMWVGKSR